MENLIELIVAKIAPVLAPGVIGAVAALASNSFLERRKREYERRSIAFALAAEMEEGLAMSERRQYEQHFKNYLEHLQAGRNVSIPHLVDEELDPLFQANMGKIGILGPELAAAVVKYQSISVGIRKDMEALASLKPTSDPNETQAQIVHKSHIIKEDLALWEEAKKSATATITKLRE